MDAKYFLSDEQKKQVMLFCYFHKNDFPIQMHSHEFYEINIIAEGTGRHYIENNSYPITSGDFFIIPPNVRHGYSETPSTFSILFFRINFSCAIGTSFVPCTAFRFCSTSNRGSAQKVI